MRAGLRKSEKSRPENRGSLLRNEVKFFRTWASNPLTTGAVSPSGRFLARAMAQAIDPHWDGPIVELGPGTGSVTAAILKRGIAPERLAAIEFNPDFARDLAHAHPGMTVIEGDAYALKATLARQGVGRPACVISSLPLFTRPAPARIALIREAMSLLEAGRPFVQFSYALVPPVPAMEGEWTLSPSEWILRNLPPARVWTYTKTA